MYLVTESCGSLPLVQGCRCCFQQCERDTRVKLPLKAQIVKPAQRIPRYELLLKVSSHCRRVAVYVFIESIEHEAMHFVGLQS